MKTIKDRTEIWYLKEKLKAYKTAVKKELDYLHLGPHTLCDKRINAEYKRFKSVAGSAIAKSLTGLIKSKTYKGASEQGKKILIGEYVDIAKDTTKMKLFIDKYTKSQLKSALRSAGVEENKLEEETEKIYSERNQ